MIWQGLLVSVRDAVEAEAALAGGAAIIDVKDPAAGSLGAASAAVVSAVAAVVGGRVPLTAAAGELRDEMACPGSIRRWLGAIATQLGPDAAAAPAAVKVGLAGLAGLAWRQAFQDTMHELPAGTVRVAVAYADWARVRAPHPLEILDAATPISGVLLIDTADKSGPGLLHACPWNELESWVTTARRAGMAVAVAGRLPLEAIPWVGRLRPDVVALRSAVCSNTRLGPVDAALVRRAATAVGALEMPPYATPRTTCPPLAQP